MIGFYCGEFKLLWKYGIIIMYRADRFLCTCPMKIIIALLRVNAKLLGINQEKAQVDTGMHDNVHMCHGDNEYT